MHHRSPVEREIMKDAKAISARYNGAPVVVIVGGATGNRRLDRTMTASANAGGRLRDLLGLLQASIQIESWKHFHK
jgi:UDP-N-acetylglucosamine:LPS N-acetylglucosamine transferase